MRRRRRMWVATEPISFCASYARTCGASGNSLISRPVDIRGEAEKLASALIGRTRMGSPLVPGQEQPIPGVGPDPDEICLNQFTFSKDPKGARCPFGAHIFRANPRNADFPGHPTGLQKLITMLGFGPKGFRDDLMSPVRFHRILRRGREYGPELLPEDALAPAPAHDPERGLQFLCLNANILRQFEFLQNAWVNTSKFSGLTEESRSAAGEPSAGSRVPCDFGFYQAARRRNSAARLRLAAVCHPARRGVFFSPQSARFALLRRSWERPEVIRRFDHQDLPNATLRRVT